MLEVTHANALIQLDQINVRIDERDILKNIDFSIGEKEIITLIGPNGAGKSTLIKIILGIVKPNSGKIKSKKQLKPNTSTPLSLF